MTTAADRAERLISSGFSVIPTRADKTPLIASWKEYQTRLPRQGELSFNGHIGLVCGKVSGNLEVLDIDAKYDPTLPERLTQQFDFFCPGEINNLPIQRTKSGGLHIFWRCRTIEGNKKLASRPTTDEERAINPHEKVKVLLETRGEGGYVIIDPTPGYHMVHGSLENIPEISPELRDQILNAAISLNEVPEEIRIPKQHLNYSPTGDLTPWDDYNQRAEATNLLQCHGWKYIHTHGGRDYYRRPGKDTGHSGTWNPEIRMFHCFTSSSNLEPNKGYTPAALYTFLECNGDFSAAGKKLRANGYGSQDQLIGKQPVPINEQQKHCKLFRPTQATSMERPKKLFGPLWAEGELAFLFADDGAGKSILAVQIGCAIGTGDSVPGFITEVTRQPVTLIDAELSDYQFNTRYPAGLPDSFKRFTFAEDQQGALIKADIQFVVDQIEGAANECNSKVIILDNLSALTAMVDLTKTSDSIQLMGLLNELKKKGFSVLVIDHCRKPMKEGEFKPISKHDLQGSKMKSNLADSVFSIGKSSQGENIRYIKALKIRSYEMAYTKNAVATMELKPDPLRLQFVGVDAEWQHVNDRNSEMMRMSNSGKSQAEIARQFGMSQQAVSKILKNE